MTHGALWRGACCGRVRGIGAAGSGPRRCAIALEEAGQAAPPPAARVPIIPSRHGAAPCSFTLSVLVLRIFAGLGLRRAAWRAEDTPLKPWGKVSQTVGCNVCGCNVVRLRLIVDTSTIS
jgi:hypothetical protein